MTLALFDLDNTLLAGDSDHAWGEFLIAKGLVDAVAYQQANDQFYRDYQAGQLDIYTYLAFALQPLTRFSLEQLQQLHKNFMDSHIARLLQPKAQELLQHHRQQGHTLLIITATNRFIAAPIAAHLGVEHLLATDLEISNGRYTGAVLGTPCFAQGKVVRLQAWLQANGAHLSGSYFYSDSINDVPLLEQVDNPVAVDPCPRLLQWAQARGTPVISLRG